MLAFFGKTYERTEQCLDIIRSNEITAVQTMLVDKVLSAAKSEEVPSADIANVLDYIDVQLAHNVVSEDIKSNLDRLYADLQARHRLA